MPAELQNAREIDKDENDRGEKPKSRIWGGKYRQTHQNLFIHFARKIPNILNGQHRQFGQLISSISVFWALL